MNDKTTIAPKCCDESLTKCSVFLVADNGVLFWGVREHDEERDPVNAVAKAKFCPFCGGKLGLEQIPMEASSAP